MWDATPLPVGVPKSGWPELEIAETTGTDDPCSPLLTIILMPSSSKTTSAHDDESIILSISPTSA
jgi:hypothetical protein